LTTLGLYILQSEGEGEEWGHFFGDAKPVLDYYEGLMYG